MIVFSRQFQEANSSEIEYQEKTIFRFLKYSVLGHYAIFIRFISDNSPYPQAFIVHIGGVEGPILINNQPYEKKKSKFAQIVIPSKAFTKELFEAKIEIDLQRGSFAICNGSDASKMGEYFDSMTFGSAMIIDELHDGWYRMKCNDFENDDDFDDCIFDIRIERDGKAIDIRDVDNNC